MRSSMTTLNRLDSAANLDEYASAVTDFIWKCTENCVSRKTIRVFPNRKPWMNYEVQSLLKARAATFRSGDTSRYMESRRDLWKASKGAKRQYQAKLEARANQRDAGRQWQGLNEITGRREKAGNINNCGTSLPDELKVLYARFEQKRSVLLPPDEPDLVAWKFIVTEEDVRRAFLKINPRKVTSPNGVPEWVLQACASELAGVFADIFNCSLLQSKIPSCFKKATIIPVPKKSKVACLNDYRPVALTSIAMKCFKRLVIAHINHSLPVNLDALQFTYRSNRSTADATSLALHSSLEHLENKDI
ncbi:uncharacterized protein [Mobula birostris]|uniref:uncharacterized protein n=1 Tax=Mobula birostris TaxID=1983395 RepID=UPI003B28C16A